MTRMLPFIARVACACAGLVGLGACGDAKVTSVSDEELVGSWQIESVELPDGRQLALETLGNSEFALMKDGTTTAHRLFRLRERREGVEPLTGTGHWMTKRGGGIVVLTFAVASWHPEFFLYRRDGKLIAVEPTIDPDAPRGIIYRKTDRAK